MRSDTSRVMFIRSPALASDEFKLLLYRPRFDTPGTFLSIVRFEEFRRVWFTARLFPARSNAVMLNLTELNNVAYANITVLQNFTNGPVEFNITAYDDAGNEFSVTQTLVSTNVIIDTVDPESSNLTIFSNNSRTDYAMAGHLLNITITADEPLKNANITILNSTYVMSVNGTMANASVNVYENSTEGEVLFNITAFDLAGNNLTVTQTNLTSSNLTIDHTHPTLSNLTIYSDNHNTSLATLGNTLNITITANENLSSANIMLLNDTYAMNITGQIANANVKVNENHTDGQVKFNITAFDLAGNNLTVNQTNLNSSNLTIDKNIPSRDKSDSIQQQS